MKTKSILLSVFLMHCICACVKPQSTASLPSLSKTTVEQKPNIVFIIGDDVGYEIPTVNGGQSYSTPNIDSLAASGINFRLCYGAADCCPSRYMLLTGKYNYRNYVDWGIMNPSEKTIGNMFSDAGYATCYAGKWQLDGGDNSIHSMGWGKYSVWLDYVADPEESYGFKYKSPRILQDGNYLTNTANKYSADIYLDYIFDFIDSNKTAPFVVYYSCPLPHKPFTPTPDDNQYATWDYSKSANKFFPSMVQYMDKQVGMLRGKIKNAGLDSNTIFIFLGDNGTPKGITSDYNGYEVEGEKGQTTTYGTHVPLIFNWPGHVVPGTYSNQLIDFTDFMPTLASLTGIGAPTAYAPIDGKDFSEVVTGAAASSQRQAVYLWFRPFNKLLIYAATANYKLYSTGQFYNVVNDIEEDHPLPNNALTPAELQTKQFLQTVITANHN